MEDKIVSTSFCECGARENETENRSESSPCREDMGSQTLKDLCDSCIEDNAVENEKCGCCGRTRARDEKELRALKNRLSRIEGQIRGISGMVDSDAYCVDILTQVSAVQAAISSFASELLTQHIKGCVINDIRNDKPETAEELAKIVEKLMR